MTGPPYPLHYTQKSTFNNQVRVSNIIRESPLIHALENSPHQPCRKTPVGNCRIHGQAGNFRSIKVLTNVMCPDQTSTEFAFQHKWERGGRHPHHSQQLLVREKTDRGTPCIKDIRLELVIPLRHPLELLGKDSMSKMVGPP